MKLTAKEFISKAEGLKSTELSLRQKLENTRDQRSGIRDSITSSQQRLERLSMRIEMLQSMQAEDDDLDYSIEISELMAERYEVQGEIEECRSRDVELQAEQADAEQDLARIKAEEAETLSDIEDSASRAGRSIQELSLYSGAFGGAASNAISSSERILAQFSQAAEILGGTIGQTSKSGQGARQAKAGSGASQTGASRNFYEAAAQQRESFSASGGKSGFGGKKTGGNLSQNSENPPYEESAGSQTGTGESGTGGRAGEFRQSLQVKNGSGANALKKSENIHDIVGKYGKGRVFQRIQQSDKSALEKFVVKAGIAGRCDFGELDDRVCREVTEVAVDMKVKFPNLDLKFLGSAQAQIHAAETSGKKEAIKNALEKYYTENDLKKNPDRDEESRKLLVDQHVNEYMNKLFTVGDKVYARSMSAAASTGNLSGMITRSMSGIGINETLGKDAEAMEEHLRSDVKAGYHPPGCDSTKAVLYHEFGHQIDDHLGASRDETIIRLYQEFSALSPEGKKSTVSTYAAKNIKEFIAECWSEGCCNPDCRPMAAKVCNRMMELQGNQREREREDR